MTVLCCPYSTCEVGLLNPGGPIAQFTRNRCSIPPIELILQSGVYIREINGITLGTKQLGYKIQYLRDSCASHSARLISPALHLAMSAASLSRSLYRDITATPRMVPIAGISI